MLCRGGKPSHTDRRDALRPPSERRKRSVPKAKSRPVERLSKNFFFLTGLIIPHFSVFFKTCLCFPPGVKKIAGVKIMMELMRYLQLSSLDRTAELLRCNRVTERFGLTLSEEQCRRLMLRRAEALRAAGRVEPGESALPGLAAAFCGSPYVSRETWEETLGELTELFYHFKGACGERLGDDELIAAMVSLYDGFAGGSVERLSDVSGRELLRFARTGRLEE